MKPMNILYCIDETKKDYSRYLGVSIISLLENNKDENVHIYILSQYIEESNKNELIRIVKNYGKKIYFSSGEIIPEKFKKILCLKGGWPIATYYRLFFPGCFDIKDRILYLDCDTIVNNNLSKFYNIDFEGNVFVGQLDWPVTRVSRKKKYGLLNYINAGVYLINIDLFKKIDLFKEFTYVNQNYGEVDYVDQDYVNIIFDGKIKLYKNLQYIIYNIYQLDYKKYLILHTVKKPNIGGYGTCPKKIEKLFNKYLKNTKRESYIFFKRKMTLKSYVEYWYTVIKYSIVDFTLLLFGENLAFIVNQLLSL